MSCRRRVEAGVAVALLFLLYPSTAWAAPATVASEPRDGSALANAPVGVELTTTRDPDAGRSHVTIWDSAGRSRDSAPLRANGDALSQPISISASGNYRCAYHIVFADGSDATGVIAFSVGTGVPPPPSTRQDRSAALAGHDHGIDPLSSVLLIIDVVVVLGVMVALFATRRGPPRPGTWRLPPE
jgi:methionine-rich copper-binding protein CopC